jgi:hypothetical protein
VKASISTVIYVERGEEELELTVYAAGYSPGRPADRRGHPDRWSPSEPEECELGDVYLGVEVRAGETGPGMVLWDGVLTAKEEEKAIDALIEEAREQAAVAWEARGDAMYDARNDY